MIMDRAEETKRRMESIKCMTTVLNKKFNTGDGIPFITTMAKSKEDVEIKFIPTGIVAIDEALDGGLAGGCISLLWGQEGSGKTSAAIMTAANILREGGFVLYVNLESTFPINMYKYYIRDIPNADERFVMIHPHQSGDDVLDALEWQLFDNKTKQLRRLYDLIIIDSMTKILPDVVIQKMIDDGIGSEGQMARRAAIQTKVLDRIVGAGLLRDGCHFLMIGQARANMDANSAKYMPDRCPGARAMTFDSKQIVYFQKKNITQKGKDGKAHTIGHQVLFQVQKNNVTGKLDRGDYSVIHGQGIDDVAITVKTIEYWGFMMKDPEWGTRTIKIPCSNGNWVFKSPKEVLERATLDPEFKGLLKELLAQQKPTPRNPPQLKENDIIPAPLNVTLEEDTEDGE